MIFRVLSIQITYSPNQLRDYLVLVLCWQQDPIHIKWRLLLDVNVVGQTPRCLVHRNTEFKMTGTCQNFSRSWTSVILTLSLTTPEFGSNRGVGSFTFAMVRIGRRVATRSPLKVSSTPAGSTTLRKKYSKSSAVAPG